MCGRSKCTLRKETEKKLALLELSETGECSGKCWRDRLRPEIVMVLWVTDFILSVKESH